MGPCAVPVLVHVPVPFGADGPPAAMAGAALTARTVMPAARIPLMASERRMIFSLTVPDP